MKKTAIASAIIICLGTFCPALQQSDGSASGKRGPVVTDIHDSDAFFQTVTRAPRPSRDNTSRVEALLRRMTLEEKVGQMSQLEIGMVTTSKDQDIQIDPTKLEKAIVKYGVGSILNVKDQALPLEKWQDIIRKIQDASQKTRLKIPVIYGIDSIHGA